MTGGDWTAALAGYVQYATLQNIALQMVSVQGHQHTGGLVGETGATVTITNCTVSGTVSGYDADVSIALTSSLNPSVYGMSTTLNVTVAPASGSGTPTGTVAFQDGSSTIATVGLDADGKASFQISTLSVGTHNLTAVYSGDSAFTTGTSATVSQTDRAGASSRPAAERR